MKITKNHLERAIRAISNPLERAVDHDFAWRVIAAAELARELVPLVRRMEELLNPLIRQDEMGMRVWRRAAQAILATVDDEGVGG